MAFRALNYEIRVNAVIFPLLCPRLWTLDPAWATVGKEWMFFTIVLSRNILQLVSIQENCVHGLGNQFIRIFNGCMVSSENDLLPLTSNYIIAPHFFTLQYYASAHWFFVAAVLSPKFRRRARFCTYSLIYPFHSATSEEVYNSTVIAGTQRGPSLFPTPWPARERGR